MESRPLEAQADGAEGVVGSLPRGPGVTLRLPRAGGTFPEPSICPRARGWRSLLAAPCDLTFSQTTPLKKDTKICFPSIS